MYYFIMHFICPYEDNIPLIFSVCYLHYYTLLSLYNYMYLYICTDIISIFIAIKTLKIIYSINIYYFKKVFT